MKTNILLVGHGSRNKNGNREIEEFATIWKAKNPEWHVETCFIEFSEVLIPEGLDNAAKGADRVIVVPLILNAAGHVKMDIPYFIANARQQHKNVEFIYALHLGATDSALKILKRNIRKAMEKIDMPDPKNTGVILLGRGSSDRNANGEVAKMARWLFEETDHELVDIAFTGITYPRLETAIQRQVKLGMTQVVIQPYYLFTGTLIERIKCQVERLKSQYPQIAISQGDYLGFAEEVYDMLSERVKDADSGIAVSEYEMTEEESHHYHHHDHDDHHDHSHEAEK